MMRKDDLFTMQATILYWTRTESDSMETASKLEEIQVSQKWAVPIAQLIEGVLEGAEAYRKDVWMKAVEFGWKGSPQGHGVTIRYGSGHTRHISRR